MLQDRSTCHRVAADCLSLGFVPVLMSNFRMADPASLSSLGSPRGSFVEDRAAWPGARSCIYALLEMSRAACAVVFEALDRLQGNGFKLQLKLEKFLLPTAPDWSWSRVDLGAAAHTAFLLALYVARGREQDLQLIFAPPPRGASLGLLASMEAYLSAPVPDPLLVKNVCFLARFMAVSASQAVRQVARASRLPQLILAHLEASPEASVPELTRTCAAHALGKLAELFLDEHLRELKELKLSEAGGEPVHEPGGPAGGVSPRLALGRKVSCLSNLGELEALLARSSVLPRLCRLLQSRKSWPAEAASVTLGVLARLPSLRSRAIALIAAQLRGGPPVAAAAAARILSEIALWDWASVAAFAFEPLLDAVTRESYPPPGPPPPVAFSASYSSYSSASSPSDPSSPTFARDERGSSGATGLRAADALAVLASFDPSLLDAIEARLDRVLLVGSAECKARMAVLAYKLAGRRNAAGLRGGPERGLGGGEGARSSPGGSISRGIAQALGGGSFSGIRHGSAEAVGGGEVVSTLGSGSPLSGVGGKLNALISESHAACWIWEGVARVGGGGGDGAYWPQFGLPYSPASAVLPG